MSLLTTTLLPRLRETLMPEFLVTAEAAADYCIAHLPADCVPLWDFQVGQGISLLPGGPRQLLRNHGATGKARKVNQSHQSRGRTGR